MPLPWALRGLRDGVVTTRWPGRPDPYFEAFQAAVSVSADPATRAARAELADQSLLDRVCPTGALQALPDDVAVDRGRCILCGRCVATVPRVFSFEAGSGTAVLRRPQLVVTAQGSAVNDEEVVRARDELAVRVRRLRRSVHIRHVDAGSDGSDEWEVQALLNPVYDVHRLGVFFTASPRHADILLVTGIGTAGMIEPLRRTRSAMPDPVVVIATGADAISGGLVGRGYTGGAGIGDILDVDIWVPGAPAPPFSLLQAILLAVDRLPTWPPAPVTAASTREAVTA